MKAFRLSSRRFLFSEFFAAETQKARKRKREKKKNYFFLVKIIIYGLSNKTR